VISKENNMELSKHHLPLIIGGTAVSLAAAGYIGYLIGLKKDKSYVHFEKRTVFKSHESGDEIDKYIMKYSLREPSVLQELREYTYKNIDTPEYLTDPIESQFFRFILNILDAKKCLEVGMYTGYNALSCALTIPTNGCVYGLEMNEGYTDVAKKFFEKANAADRLKTFSGSALENMEKLLEEGHSETFDFVYIDADKQNYGNYLDKALLLVRVGGVIALDNTLYQGLVVDLNEEASPVLLDRAKAIHKLNEKLKADKRFLLSFLRISDGVTLCQKV